MNYAAGSDYLTTEVMTATPQKLQLLLIDAALRSVAQARRHWQENRQEPAAEALLHSQQIVAEMIGGIDRQKHPALAGQIVAVYLFIHRSLVEANLTRSTAKLDDAVRLLEMERETWRMACQQVAPKTLPLGRAEDDLPSLGQSFVA